MTTQKLIPLEAQTEWIEALKGIKHAFAHTWDNCYAMHLTTRYRTYLYCFEEDHTRIVCPIAERPIEDCIDIVTPYGFSGFSGNFERPNFMAVWEKFAMENGYVCAYISLNPLFENKTYSDEKHLYVSSSLYFIDLKLSEAEIYARIDRNRKRQLKNWEHLISLITVDKKILKEFFLSNYHQFLQCVNASAANYFSLETLAYICELDNVLMIGAKTSEHIVALYVIAYTPYAGDCLFNITTPEGRKYNTALLWYGLKHLKSKNIPYLNLGGGLQENDSIAQSKQRFGSQKLPFRCIKQIFRPDVYKTLCQRVNADPQNMSGYFPAYRSSIRKSNLNHIL